MRKTFLLLALTVPALASAQTVRILPRASGGTMISLSGDRPMIGVTTDSEGSRGDTLGLRIVDVTEGSPAAKAGIKAGDRLQAVNGISLRAAKDDAGDDDYAGVLTRRLQREVARVGAGKELELQLWSDGSRRTVKLSPVEASELTTGGMARSRARLNDRGVIGVTITGTGTKRDTLGVFVQGVSEDGPAEKAGIIEGDRIAAINGVSLRVAAEDAGDAQVSASRVERLTRELAKVEVGSTVELQVVSAGRTRTVRVTVVRASELKDQGYGGDFEWSGTPRAFSIPGGELMLPRVPMPPRALSPSMTPLPPDAPRAPQGEGRVRVWTSNSRTIRTTI